jgi:desampylase
MGVDESTVELQLSAAAWTAVAGVARRASPEECCGALIGRRTRAAVVCRTLSLPNRAADRHRAYLIPGSAVRRVEAAAERAGLDVIGFYHSHPHGGTVPSHSDLEAAWPGYVYLIVGDGAAAWRLLADRSGFEPVPLRVIE